MSKKNIPYSILILIIIIIGLFTQCTEKEKKKKSPRIRKLTKVISPKYDAVYSLIDTLNYSISTVQDTVSIDSFKVEYTKKEVYNSNHPKGNSTFIKTGIKNLKFTVYLSNGKKESHTQKITILSGYSPIEYSYQKINTFTHDPDAYTQGLFYEDGYLYESTGQVGESTLRKVEIKTGKVIKNISLSSQYFGEGITTLGNKIFMLTWKSKQGFVYNKNTFEQISTFNYPTEGWGITTIGDSLVMSDGTENLYFLDPETLTETSRIQVYDQYRPIKDLNELEYINGKIYANIYQTDEMAIIDPMSGKLEGRINLSGIFNKSNYGRRLDVLNGIAYDKTANRLFVTGKWWPKLYEIAIYETTKNQ